MSQADLEPKDSRAEEGKSRGPDSRQNKTKILYQPLTGESRKEIESLFANIGLQITATKLKLVIKTVTKI